MMSTNVISMYAVLTRIFLNHVEGFLLHCEMFRPWRTKGYLQIRKQINSLLGHCGNCLYATLTIGRMRRGIVSVIDLASQPNN